MRRRSCVSISGPTEERRDDHRPELHEADRADGRGRAGQPVDLHEQRDHRDLRPVCEMSSPHHSNRKSRDSPQRTDVDREPASESERGRHGPGNGTHGTRF